MRGGALDLVLTFSSMRSAEEEALPVSRLAHFFSLPLMKLQGFNMLPGDQSPGEDGKHPETCLVTRVDVHLLDVRQQGEEA